MSDRGERRRSKRVDASLNLQLYLEQEQDEAAHVELETINISTSGVYFRSSRYMEPMTKLAIGLELAVPGADGDAPDHALVHCQGLVVRSDPDEEQDDGAKYEVAVFFTWLEPEGQEVLEKHINLLLTDS